MTEPIISVSGLRGIVGQGLNAFVAARYAIAFSKTLAPGQIIVSRDGRENGPQIKMGALTGLASAGRRVLDADIAATPTLGVLVREYNAAGGIQISASHNPPEYNGLKLFGPDGRVIPAELGRRPANVHVPEARAGAHSRQPAHGPVPGRAAEELP